MFTHLHVHSHYSLLDGMAKIEDLISRAKKEKMSALAITDHGVMYGVIEFYKQARIAGVKPIIGAELYVAPGSRFSKKSKIDDRPFHLTLLSKNEEGYKNLLILTSLAHLDGFYYKPRIDVDLLKTHHRGLIALSGCLGGEIPQAILQNKKNLDETVKKYYDIFGEDFYLEAQTYDSPEQKKVTKELERLGQKHGIKIVATSDVHFLDKDDAEIQDILLCLQTKKKISDLERMTASKDSYFHSESEMRKFFKNNPEFVDNTQEIVNKCNITIELEKIKFPEFNLPNNENPNDYLKKICYQKLSNKYPKITPEIKKRLDYELEVIKKTGFATYFLIVQDFVSWAKNNNIMVGPGRGSAAGSIVAYVLGITSIDPLKYNLIFERFLNPERISAPDIDLDFADTRRDEVIKYIEEKYNKNNVAQIITFGTMAARVAIRDVGRVLEIPYSFCDKLAKMIPPFLSLNQALEKVKELKDVYLENQDAKKIINIAKKLEGVARHASTHACGIVITPQELNAYLPTQYDVSREEKILISQYSMYAVADLGLLKIDLLGLKNLTLLEKTIELIKKEGQKIDLEKIDSDDKKTFELLKRAETVGVFQLESQGIRRYLKELKPNIFEDIIAMIALYRPGPIELIPKYIAGKRTKKVSYLHPKLKPILENTHGVAIYQEQILRIARDLAGFSLSEADILRKAIGKKIKGLLKEQEKKFIDGCIKQNIEKSVAEKIFNFIEPFAGYAFNRAHATCYATIAYQTAYLKANWPTEFMTALLITDAGDLDRMAVEIEEAKRINIKVSPPEINESQENFAIIKKDGRKEIRFGLMAIKNVGEGVAKTIIKERNENGAYQNLEDFLSRLPGEVINKKSLESLIKAGALDCFEERNVLLENLETILNISRSILLEKKSLQKSLFQNTKKNRISLQLKRSNQKVFFNDLLNLEKEFLGLYISGHPFEGFESIAQKKGAISSIKLSETNDGDVIRMAGVVTKIKKIITNSQEPMLFVKIEDLTGSVEVLVFPKILKQTTTIWQENKVIILEGRVSEKDGEHKIIIIRAKELIKNII